VLSFNVLLNQSTDFEGGGTYFKHLDRSVTINQGDFLLHSGLVLHGGHPITSGIRFILVGFIDVNPYGPNLVRPIALPSSSTLLQKEVFHEVKAKEEKQRR